MPPLHDRRGHRFHELFLRGIAPGRPTMPRSVTFVLIIIVRAAFLRCAQCMFPDLPDLPNRFADGSRILDAVPPNSAVRGHHYALRAQQRVRAPCHSFRRFAAAPPQQTGPSVTDDTVREPRVHAEAFPQRSLELRRCSDETLRASSHPRELAPTLLRRIEGASYAVGCACYAAHAPAHAHAAYRLPHAA